MEVVKKGSKLYSILYCKCPKCQNGDLFIEKNPWKFRSMLDMPERCSNCDQDFTIEPGFYYGALWMSYPLVVIVAISLLVPLWLFPESYVGIISVMILCLFAIQPMLMRWGRAIWLNVFVSYDPDEMK